MLEVLEGVDGVEVLEGTFMRTPSSRAGDWAVRTSSTSTPSSTPSTSP